MEEGKHIINFRGGTMYTDEGILWGKGEGISRKKKKHR